MSELTDAKYLKFLLSERGYKLNRALGQNFLVSEKPVRAVVENLDPNVKNVTELGPGVGTLTEALLDDGFNVRAIEKDERWVEILEKLQRTVTTPGESRATPPGKLLTVHGDLRKEKWDWGEKKYQLVGNIPYNLSGLIFRMLSQLQPVPEKVILLVQKEVAERLTAQPPNMNLLGLSMQMWGEVKKIIDVPKGSFYPVPKVNSRLIEIVPHLTTHATPGESLHDTPGVLAFDVRDGIMKLAKICFAGKRKQIGGSLKRGLKISDEEVQRMLDEAGVEKEQRPQELSIEQWYNLLNASRKNIQE